MKASDNAYRPPWLLGALVFFIVLAVDIKNLAPWVSWAHQSQDSGDLICSAYFLGIPHPTGYPTYCMLAKLFQVVIPAGNIAWRTNLMSATSAALCCAIITMALHRLFYSASLTGGGKQTRGWFVPALAGFALGFGKSFLAQSVVSEVYALNALMVGLILFIIIEIFCLGNEGKQEGVIGRYLVWLSFIYGVAVTSHLSSAFLLPLVISAFITGRVAFSPRTIVKCAIFLLLGLTPFLYLPIRSAANPPFDWGNPQTWDGFIWVVSGKQFKHLMFASFDYEVIYRLLDNFEPVHELGLALSLLTLWGAGVGLSRGTIAKVSLLATALLVLNLYPVMNYHIPDTPSFLLPTYIAVTVLFAIGLHNILQYSFISTDPGLKAAVILLVLITAIPAYRNNLRYGDLSDHLRPREYASAVYTELPENAILIEKFYGRAFTMWYQHYIESGRNRKKVAVIYAEHLMFDWGIEVLKRQSPWIDFPEPDMNSDRAIAALVELNISKYPVFVSREIPLLNENYEFAPYGEIFFLKLRDKNESGDDINSG